MFGKLFGRSRQGYVRVPISRDEEMKMNLLNGKVQEESDLADNPIDIPLRRSSTSWRSRPVFLAYTLFTMINLAIMGVMLANNKIRFNVIRPRNWHQRMTTMPSPLYDAMDIELLDIQWEGNIFNNATSNIFRQPPSPEVDQAWAAISDIKTFLVDRVDIERAGKDPENSVRAPESWGVGEKWIAQLDGPHQLHCLDVIRRQLYRDYYYGPTGTDGHPLFWHHVVHCLDIVRQSLMCSSSIDLLTFNFKDNEPGPDYNFNVNKRCRNHQAIIDWADEHEVDWEKNGWIARPEGYPTVPEEEGYFELVPALRAYNAAHGVSSSTTPPPVPKGTNHKHGHIHGSAYAERQHAGGAH